MMFSLHLVAHMLQWLSVRSHRAVKKYQLFLTVIWEKYPTAMKEEK
jgi:hypothetical protein